MKGVFDRPLSRDAVPDHYPNENHARMNMDDVAPAEETTEMGSIPTEEQVSLAGQSAETLLTFGGFRKRIRTRSRLQQEMNLKLKTRKAARLLTR